MDNAVGNSDTNAVVQLKFSSLIVSLVIGALLGLGLVLPLDPVITMPNELGAWPANPTSEYVAQYNQAYSKMWMGNLAINFSIIGAAIGVVTAILSMHGASLTSRLLSVILSLLGGSLGGLLIGFMLASAHSTQGRLDIFGWALDPMLQSVLFQAICWSGIGMGVGAGIAQSRHQAISHGIVGGLVGGLAAGFLHAFIGSIIFPNSDMANLLPPNTLEKFIWAGYSGACLGCGIWIQLKRSRRQEATVAAKEAQPISP